MELENLEFWNRALSEEEICELYQKNNYHIGDVVEFKYTFKSNFRYLTKSCGGTLIKNYYKKRLFGKDKLYWEIKSNFYEIDSDNKIVDRDNNIILEIPDEDIIRKK